MHEKRFVTHDSSVQDYVENVENKNKKKSDSGCGIDETIFYKRKTRRAKVVHHTTRRSTVVKYLPEFIPFFDEKMETTVSLPGKSHSKH